MSFLKRLMAVFRLEAERDAYRQVSPGEACEAKIKRALEYVEKGESSLDRGHFADAAASLTQATILNPNDDSTFVLLGIAQAQRGHQNEAIICFERALSLNNVSFAAHYNLGATKLSLGKLDEAELHCRNALACENDRAIVWDLLGMILRDQWRIKESIEAYRKSIQLDPRSTAVRSNLLWTLQYDDSLSQAELYLEHRSYGEYVEKLYGHLQPNKVVEGSTERVHRKLRIGYVSADLNAHSAALFLLAIIEHHDRSRFEITCYHAGVKRDAMTSKIASTCDHFVDCLAMSVESMAQAINSDGIDILIDLGGHTAHNQLPVFACKPAPIQVTYIGYVDTTGLSAIDYKLTCINAYPPECANFAAEKLFGLNRSFTYRPAEGLPDVTTLPALENGYITFLSNNQISKITDSTIRSWSSILKKVPSSRLLILGVSSDVANRRVIEAFGGNGIEPERVALIGRVSLDEFRKRVMACDIMLDTYPFNGGTTTCETLFLGVPVVTRKGQRFSSRVGLSILGKVGLERLVASTADEYIDLAVRLARDLEQLSMLRGELRQAVMQSSICDEVGFTRGLEAAFAEMWEAHIAGDGTAAVAY
jgi:protein O-GlcNAc transferase